MKCFYSSLEMPRQLLPAGGDSLVMQEKQVQCKNFQSKLLNQFSAPD